MFNLIALIEGLISSAPEAIQLWEKLAPIVSVKAEIPQDKIDEINQLAPAAVAAVQTSAAAISALVAIHPAAVVTPAGG